MTQHSHGAHSHDHDVDVEAPDHTHHVNATVAVDPDTGTTCGHIGSDPGAVRHIVRNVVHEGDEHVLCGDCLAPDWWAERDAEKAALLAATA